MSASYLKRAAEKQKISKFLSYKEYLEAIYLFLKEDLSKYSFKQYSADLAVAPDNASWLIITGRRKLTESSAKKIAAALGLKKLRRQYFLALVKQNNARVPEDQEKWMKKVHQLKWKIEQDASHVGSLEYCSKWYFPIIRELVGLIQFNPNPNWISKVLFPKILPKEVEYALETLQKLNFIHYDKKQDRFQQSQDKVDPTLEMDKIATLRYHQHILQLTYNCINQVPEEEYDINALTLRLSKEGFDKANKILLKACEDIFALEEKPEQTHALFQINTQLFPLTRSKELKK